MELRQRGYARRASQQDELAVRGCGDYGEDFHGSVLCRVANDRGYPLGADSSFICASTCHPKLSIVAFGR